VPRSEIETYIEVRGQTRPLNGLEPGTIWPAPELDRWLGVPTMPLTSSTVLTIAIGFVSGLLLVQPASALTAETVKNCRLMARDAYPTKKSDGKTSAAVKAQNQFFSNCISTNVKLENTKAPATVNTPRRNPTTVAPPSSGVRTGQGPLSQPIPPAVSTTNPQQNSQGGILRPQNMQGPAQTNPSQNPFGSK
jgi:hypothetical protein